MCVVSMVMDHYHDKWRRRMSEPYIVPMVPYPVAPPPVVLPVIPQPPAPVPVQPALTPEEVEEFRRLLERAREYDRTHNQPDCEMDEKRKAIKELARSMGVEIEFV